MDPPNNPGASRAALKRKKHKKKKRAAAPLIATTGKKKKTQAAPPPVPTDAAAAAPSKKKKKKATAQPPQPAAASSLLVVADASEDPPRPDAVARAATPRGLEDSDATARRCLRALLRPVLRARGTRRARGRCLAATPCSCQRIPGRVSSQGRPVHNVSTKKVGARRFYADVFEQKALLATGRGDDYLDGWCSTEDVFGALREGAEAGVDVDVTRYDASEDRRLTLQPDGGVVSSDWARKQFVKGATVRLRTPHARIPAAHTRADVPRGDAAGMGPWLRCWFDRGFARRRLAATPRGWGRELGTNRGDASSNLTRRARRRIGARQTEKRPAYVPAGRDAVPMPRGRVRLDGRRERVFDAGGGAGLRGALPCSRRLAATP